MKSHPQMWRLPPQPAGPSYRLKSPMKGDKTYTLRNFFNCLCPFVSCMCVQCALRHKYSTCRQNTLNTTLPGFSTPPNSRIPIMDSPPPPRQGSEQNQSPNLVNAQVLPALVSPPLLRVSALRNRLALRRQNAFARSRRVDTPRARYISLESPSQDPVTGFLDRFPVTPRALARPRMVDTPLQVRSTSHEVEEEVCSSV